MITMASQITSLTVVWRIVYSDADQRKHQNSPSLAFVCGIHGGPVNSPHKWSVTRKMFPFDDVIMLDNLGIDGLPRAIFEMLVTENNKETKLWFSIAQLLSTIDLQYQTSNVYVYASDTS